MHFVFALKHKSLKQALSRRRKRHIVDGSRLQSAVLVPIFQKQGQYHVLLTQRTDKVKEHKGEISFPGGACEEADGTLVNTALRESAEEIGLAAEAVEVLGSWMMPSAGPRIISSLPSSVLSPGRTGLR